MPASANRALGGGGEVIRCGDLAALTAFYRDILRLEVIEESDAESAVQLRAGEGYAGACDVVLFAADDEDELFSVPQHLTLVVADAETLARAEAWLRANGLAVETTEHAWAGWKCLSVRDPEGNAVELAAPVRQRTLPAETVSGQG